MTVFERASMRNTQSALRYETVPMTWDEGAHVWYNNDQYFTASPFKGFHVNTDGYVSVIGIDGIPFTFSVKAGMTYPYGGIGIDPVGTTVTPFEPSDLILLF